MVAEEASLLQAQAPSSSIHTCSPQPCAPDPQQGSMLKAHRHSSKGLSGTPTATCIPPPQDQPGLQQPTFRSKLQPDHSDPTTVGQAQFSAIFSTPPPSFSISPLSPVWEKGPKEQTGNRCPSLFLAAPGSVGMSPK